MSIGTWSQSPRWPAALVIAAGMALAGARASAEDRRTKPFQIPSRARQLAAVGDVSKLSKLEQRAFRVTGDFETIRAPKANDWLASHEEEEQTFDDFARSSPNIPDARSHTIYVQPLGAFNPDRSPALADIRDYGVAFFGLKVELLPVLELTRTAGLHSRVRQGGLVQYRTAEILELLKNRMPEDACCVVGVTMEDLYPDEKWNFVFGEAELTDRVGVFSFKRFTPDWEKRPWTDESRRLLLRRSCDVLAHETGHMFGLQHCTFFECVMCGSNHQAESDSRPMHCCPVCLRKLHSGARFDLVGRYRALFDFCEKRGLKDEASWNRRQIAELTADTILTF